MLARFILDPSLDLQAVLRAIDGAHDEMRGHRFVQVDRQEELERLRPIDGAGAGQQHPHHRGEDRRRQHSLKDPAAELRFAREFFVDVKRIYIAGDFDEAPHVLFGKFLAEADMLADVKILDPFHFNSFFHRVHASSRAFLFASDASGASPARMNPWPAPSYVTTSYVFLAAFISS